MPGGVTACAAIFLVTVGSAMILAQPLSAPPLGHISFPNSGAPAAQSRFIRGVLYLHSFEYDSAIDEFRQTEKIDPGFAMAYWGEALAYDQPLWMNQQIDRARAALGRLAPTRAGRQAKAPTAREKGYLDAVDRLYGEGDAA